MRGDDNEGTSVYRPESGLAITNYSQRTESVRADSAFEAEVKAGEIFVYCMSKADTPRLRAAFNAVACVEIMNVAEFCRRVQKALTGASFGGRPGRERIGHPVDYYSANVPPGPRWACPDLIACAKFDGYDWQHEYRLLFSRTEALKFENVKLTIVKGKPRRIIDPSQHHVCEVVAGSLEDIA
ncbi:MAG: hypothetical protein ABIO78_02120, partial [Thermoanaerobaculia bacterium]